MAGRCAVSRIRQAAEDCLCLRRALGYALEDAGRLLMDFVEFAERTEADTLTTGLAVAWAIRTRAEVNPAHWHRRLGIVRGFARHLRALDPATEIPPEDLMPFHYRRVAPHLYTPQEITALIQATRLFTHPLKARTYAALIGLLACTGMRVGEACALDRGDIDTREAIARIRAGKLGKAREVPLHPSAVAALDDYAAQRDQLCPAPSSPAFFLNARGTRQAAKRAAEDFPRLREAAGIRPAPGGRAPRTHDLRHTFCITTLMNWYRDGADVQARLPLLSTYLGHVDPVSTYWYLHAAPELMSLAALRLETYLEATS
jgi:integrase/recombinase XerD